MADTLGLAQSMSSATNGPDKLLNMNLPSMFDIMMQLVKEMCNKYSARTDERRQHPHVVHT